MIKNLRRFGIGDSTYQAAGGEQGIRDLVDSFYEIMASNPDYQTIWSMHPEDKSQTRDKLARFLCGWMGGPRLYQEKYGPISIPLVHAHLKITAIERDQWLECMALALERQAYEPKFIEYLLKQLSVPADRIRELSEKRDG